MFRVGGCQLEGSLRWCVGVLGQQGVTFVGGEVGIFSLCDDDFYWNFTGVYDLTRKKEREGFWGELRVVRGPWGGPWCVVDDFNVVRFPMECSRGGRLTFSMRRIFEIIEDLELKDLPL